MGGGGEAQQAHIVPHKGQTRVRGFSLNKEQNKTKLSSSNRTYARKEEDKARSNKTAMIRPEHHKLVPIQCREGWAHCQETYRRCGLAKGGKWPIFGIQPRPLLGGILLGRYLYPKYVANG